MSRRLNGLAAVVAASLILTGFSATRATADDLITHRFETSANDGASDCVHAGKVWVFVERDTGVQEGGCASEFGTGLQALNSAGFSTTGGAFITAINGYPSASSSDHYWSYWHAQSPVTQGGKTSYSWEYSQLGATAFHPKPGAIEGWRFISLSEEESPSWVPVVDAPATTAITASAPSVYFGRSTAIVVTSPGAAAGTVTATANGVQLSAALSDGSARILVPARAFSPGRHLLSVAYHATTSDATASTTTTLTVVKAPVRLAAKLSGKKIKYKKSARIVVTASATGTVPSGTVRVTIGSRTRSATLNRSGVAVVAFTKFTLRGTRTVTVRYLGSTLCGTAHASTRLKIIR